MLVSMVVGTIDLSREDYLQMNLRVPVISPFGRALMPTKASRARRMVKQNKAVGKWNDAGIYYIQLKSSPTDVKTQPIHLGCNPGKSYTGIGIQGSLTTWIFSSCAPL